MHTHVYLYRCVYQRWGACVLQSEHIASTSHQILVVILLWVSWSTKQKRKEKKCRMEKLFNLVASYISWYVFACTAIQSWQRRWKIQSAMIHSFPSGTAALTRRAHLRLMWFRIMQKKTPSHLLRFVTKTSALDSWIKPLQVKVCQSMRPTDRLAAELALLKRNMWFCFSLFLLNSMKIAKSKLNREKTYAHTHTHNRFFHSRTHFTNNLIFDTALRMLSILLYLCTHILFAVFIVRSNRYKHCVCWRK